MSLRTGVPELIVGLDAALELYTVLYTIVDLGNHVPYRLRREVVVSQSDILFRASCTEADDGVDTDVIRAV